MSPKSSLKINRATVLESEEKKDIIDYARSRGWLHRHVEFVNRVGCPDSIFIREGRTVWVEFKRPVGGRLAQLQKKTIKKLKKWGAEVYVLRELKDAKKIFK